MLQPSDPERKEAAKAFLHDGAPNCLEAYSAYFQFYNSVICPSNFKDTIVRIDNPAFISHEDVLRYGKDLKHDPTMTRSQLMSLFPVINVSEKDKEDAVRAVVKVAFMIDCAAKENHPEGFAVGDFAPLKWEINERFVDFATRAFPSSTLGSPSELAKIRDAQVQKKCLKAWKLKKRYKIKFRGTENIAEHLLYDQEEGTVKVFHHTAFLKSHLLRSRDQPIDLGFLDSLKIGTLPPRLILETLDSIQYVLFPVSTDTKSLQFLKKLIQKQDFDPDTKWVEGRLRDLPERFDYIYWGDRLVRLHDIVNRPPPSNQLVAWFERHTSERNALTVAILGLFLTALLGLLSLLVGIVQLVFAILQYKSQIQSQRVPQKQG